MPYKISFVALFILLSGSVLAATQSEGAVAEVPSIGSCKALSFQNAAAVKWPLPLWLCHLDGQAAKETLASQDVITTDELANNSPAKNARLKSSSSASPPLDLLTTDIPPSKADYQLLADLLLRSDVPSMALAQHLLEFLPANKMLSGNKTSAVKVVLFLGLSPYFGCQLQYQANNAEAEGKFTDPCTGAEWSLQGTPVIAAFDKPVKPLLRFPYQKLNATQIQFGNLAPEFKWQELSFVPDITDSQQPVFDRLLKTVLWGRLADAKTLWPQLLVSGEAVPSKAHSKVQAKAQQNQQQNQSESPALGQAQLTESQQAQLFINAAAKEHLLMLAFLKSQGLNPHAKTEMGGSAQQVAELIQSDKVIAWLKAN
jgi:hypothetical protein